MNTIFLDNRMLGVAWGPMVTIPADTDLGTLGYAAIASETGFTVYWGTDTANTYSWPANTAFIISKTKQAKITTETLCAVVGG